MLAYILKKWLLSIVTVVATIIVISFIIYKAPIDAASVSFGQRNNPNAIAQLRKQNYLDLSFTQQLAYYFIDLSPIQIIGKSDARLLNYKYKKLLDINDELFILKFPYLRKSFITGDPIDILIKRACIPTLVLALSAILIACIVGVTLGLISAYKHATFLDQFIMGVCTLGFSIPSYIAAIFFSVIFGYVLSPYLGLPMQGGLFEFDDLGDVHLRWINVILPAIALGIRPVSVICQMTRSSVLEVLQQDYVRTAVSKGLRIQSIIQKHVVLNAANPMLTTVTGWFASLLTGSFFIEFVFNYRGLGDLTINALNQFDVPLILACCIFITVIFTLVSLITDILYVFFDPRIKLLH